VQTSTTWLLSSRTHRRRLEQRASNRMPVERLWDGRVLFGAGQCLLRASLRLCFLGLRLHAPRLWLRGFSLWLQLRLCLQLRPGRLSAGHRAPCGLACRGSVAVSAKPHQVESRAQKKLKHLRIKPFSAQHRWHLSDLWYGSLWGLAAGKRRPAATLRPAPHARISHAWLPSERCRVIVQKYCIARAQQQLGTMLLLLTLAALGVDSVGAQSGEFRRLMERWRLRHIGVGGAGGCAMPCPI
jgi:hypothetical protein